MLARINKPSVLEWINKGFWAVLDQGLFSGANFLVNILLARWLSPQEYGAFVVALSVFYLLAGFHTTVLTEPMMVFGAGKYREQFRKYLGMLLWGHWGISTLIALGLGIAAWVFYQFRSQSMAEALLGLAIASPFLLLLWLMRRAPYVQMRPQWAVVGSGLNFLATLCGLFLLWRWGWISSFNAFLILGVGAVLASFMIFVILRPQVAGYVGNPTSSIVFDDHWRYGKWNILAFSLYWASGQVLMILIPIFLGLAASAAVAAIWNLYRPVSLLMQSLGLLILPTFSRWIAENMPAIKIRRKTNHLAFFLGGAIALYGVVLTVFAKPILVFFYAGKYIEEWMLVPLFGASTTMSVTTHIFISLLKARGNMRSVSSIWAISAISVVIFSLPLMYLAGVEGAIVAALIAYTITFWIAFKIGNSQ